MTRLTVLLICGSLACTAVVRGEGDEHPLPPLLTGPAADYAAKEKALDDELITQEEAARRTYVDVLNAAIAKIERGTNVAEADLIRAELKRFAKDGLDSNPSDKQPAVVKSSFKALQKEEERVTLAVAPKRTALRTGYLRTLAEVEKTYTDQKDAFAVNIVRRARGVVLRRTAVETNNLAVLGTDPKAAEVKDLAPPGGFLVGLETGQGPWLGFQVTGGLKPIFATADGTTAEGKSHGNFPHNVRTVAKEGYAVGGLLVRPRESQGHKPVLGCIQIVFMKINPDGATLDPNDNYKTDWLGGDGGGKVKEFSGQGKMIVGIRIQPGEIIDNLCLVALK
ncbi:MAG: hypothetical protein JWO82_4460 [Akkermansiaceae bacterium]|nr:hypothetical protein [Akkermansiaceae bacterium]